MDGLTWQQVVAALGTVLASWFVSRGGIKAKRIESAASPYAALSERVVSLERQVDTLREEVRTLRDANDELRDENDRAHALNADQRRLVSEADDYISDLHARWPEHRQKPHPPHWRWLTEG